MHALNRATPSFLDVLILTTLAGLILGGLLAVPAAAEPQPAASGEEGASPGPTDPCRRHADLLCRELGEDDQACSAAHLVAALLPAAACEAALADPDHAKAAAADLAETCGRLFARLCEDLGPQTQTCRELLKQVDRFPGSRCFFMEQSYGAVLADLRRQEARYHPLPDELLARLLEGEGPGFGPKEAPVTIVEFSDFECPYCARAATTATAIREKHPESVRFVFRQLPLPMHANAELAAQASLEAHAQGRFWPFHDAAFEHAKDLDREGLLRRATEAGLDVAAFTEAIDTGRHAKAVAADVALAQEADATGTPTMFLNGKRLPDPGDTAAVLAAIEEALAGEGRAPENDGTR